MNKETNFGILLGIVSFPDVLKIVESKKQTDKLRAKGIKIRGKSK